ncbi:MAG TPA: hypothetical protein VEA40_07865 [Ramlibacter sp.]|nr:hypothetical protein [Ramlibacter sp.]
MRRNGTSIALGDSFEVVLRLDEWLAHVGIACARRYVAAADTLANCELLLRVWPRAARECANWHGVQALAARQRWGARR